MVEKLRDNKRFEKEGYNMQYSYKFSVPGLSQEWTVFDSIIEIKTTTKSRDNCHTVEIEMIDKIDLQKQKKYGCLAYHICGSKNLFFDGFLCYHFEDEEEIREILEYIDSKRNSIVDDIEYIIENDSKMEIKLRCSSCGAISCFTGEDYKKNKSNETVAGVTCLGSMISALGGNYLGSSILNNMNRDTIRDFTQCPKCGSRKMKKVE